MSWMNNKKMTEQRESLLAKSRGIVDAAKKEDRQLTTDEIAEIEKTHEEVKALDSQLNAMAKVEAYSKVEETEENSINTAAEKVVKAKDLRQFSILKAIRESIGSGLTGLEREVSQEYTKQFGKEPRSFYLPLNLPVEKRDLTLTTGAGGKDGTFVDAANFVELLRNKMLVKQLGAKMVDGLVGDYQLPKQTGGATAYWVTEGSDPTESNATVGQVNFAPSTVGAYTDVTRKYILQTSFSAEQFARDDLATVIALELDRIAYNGSGSGAEPQGILQNSSCPTVAIDTNGGAPTFAKIVELETEVADANADIRNLAYVTTPQGKGTCKTVKKDAGSGIYLWENNELNGYQAYATNQMPSDLTKASGSDLSSMIFGNWADVVYAFWSGVDVLVDPYTNSKAGTIRIVCHQDCDMQLRHAESFAKIVDLFTAESSAGSV